MARLVRTKPLKRTGRLSRGSKQLRQWFQLPPKSSRAYVKRQLDIFTSLIVRGRDGRCVLCGESRPELLTCGHFYKRGWIGTRYDLRNCNCLCKACNEADNRKPNRYLAFMLDYYGPDTVSALFVLRNNKRHIPTEELELLLAEYRGMYQRMQSA